jgi:hypothetical protein
MTKSVRIENADTSNYKVRIREQNLDTATGEWVDTLGEAYLLLFPTAMVTLGVHSHRRLIVEEVAA